MSKRKDADVAAEWIRGAFGWIVISLVAILVIPAAVVIVLGYVQGTVPSSDAGGVLGAGPGYPAFPPPYWLLWLPALATLALSIATWRYPGQFMDSVFSARWDLGIVSVFGASATVAAAVVFGGPFVTVVLLAAIPWVLTLLVLVSRGIWDGITDARAAFRPDRARTATGRTAQPAPTRASIPALRISADAGTWQRTKQRLTLRDGDPRAVKVAVYDSATDDLGLARALVAAIDGEDAAPPRSTRFSGGPGVAVRTVRTISGRAGARITATWHWDDGKRAVLMTVQDLDPDRFAQVEPELDALAGAIAIGTP